MIECGPGLIDWARILYVCTIWTLISDPHTRSLRTVGPGLNDRDLFHVVKLKKREGDFFLHVYS